MEIKSYLNNISKSDFRLFREAPRHLWAKKNNRLDPVPTDKQLASIQGEQVEQRAKEYLESLIQSGRKLSWQETRSDGPFMARADVLAISADGSSADLYEIKSSTEVKKEDVEDAAFQVLIFQKHYRIERIYLVLVDNTYILHGPLDLTQLLKVENITEQVLDILPDIESLRTQAHVAAKCADPNQMEHCWKPDDCICLDICHPNLPDFSIYNIPQLNKDKKRQLEDMGIRAANKIPQSFELSDIQRGIANLARLDSPRLDTHRIRIELEKIKYPIFFLDYESCNPAVPQYDGYKPYQQIVFQYSLHRLDGPKSELEHFEYLSTSEGDPALPLLESLNKNLGEQGTVVVWNAPFEKTRNREMALLYPKYTDFLDGVNHRIHDLMEMVSKGLYLHPGFKGSSSIKHVLPVMVPEMSYSEMEINNGTKASLGWWNIMFSDLDENEKNEITQRLLDYCKLDTLAMVEIYRRFLEL